MSAELLRESYSQHPDFTFPEASLPCPDGALNSFNAAYEQLRAGGHKMHRNAFARIVRTALGAIDAVFADLFGHAADDLERRFLTELQAECVRLTVEELEFFRTRSLESDRVPQLAADLTSRHHFFGILPSSVVAEIRSIASADLIRLRANAAAGKLTREDLTVSAGPTVKRITGALNRAFRVLGVLEAVSQYAGRTMRVRGAAFELSVPQSVWWRNSFASLLRPPHTLYAHLDESISVPKAIVYLSDVDETNGPTSCYPGIQHALDLNPLQAIIGRVIANVGAHSSSPLHGYYDRAYHQAMSSPRFRRHFMRLPAQLRFNSHFGWDVRPDSELETKMVGAEHRMVGAAGTFVVFDGGNLVHRGGLVQGQERIALQVIFGEANLWRRVRTKLGMR